MPFRHVLIAVLFAAAFSAAPAHAETPVAGLGKCPADTAVVVEVRGVQLLVPRSTNFRILLDDGTTRMTPGRPSAGYTCDTPVIPNVRGLATNSYKIGIFGNHNGSEKEFTKRRLIGMGAAKLRGSLETRMPDGIVKIDAPAAGEEYFKLPSDAAPTYDQMPVTFACDNAEEPQLAAILPRYCTVAYLHPSGVPFSYSVLRSDYPTNDFIAADKKIRKALDDMIAGAKAKKDLENKDK